MFFCSETTTEALDHAGCLCHRPEIRIVTERMNAALSRRGFMSAVAASAASFGLGTTAFAQQPAPSRPARPTLFTNIRLFDGTSPSLRSGVQVLVEGNRIRAVLGGGEAAPPDVVMIDGGGRVVMPGLIDAHTHLIFSSV